MFHYMYETLKKQGDFSGRWHALRGRWSAHHTCGTVTATAAKVTCQILPPTATPPIPPGLGWAMEGRGHRPGEAAKCSTSHFSTNRIFHLNCDKAQTYEDMMAVITTYGSRFYNTKKGRFIGQLKLLPDINIIPMKGQRL